MLGSLRRSCSLRTVELDRLSIRSLWCWCLTEGIVCDRQRNGSEPYEESPRTSLPSSSYRENLPTSYPTESASIASVLRDDMVLGPGTCPRLLSQTNFQDSYPSNTTSGIACRCDDSNPRLPSTRFSSKSVT